MIDMVLIVLEHKDPQNLILLDLVPKLNVKGFFREGFLTVIS